MIIRNRTFDLFLSWFTLVLYADIIFVFSSMQRAPFRFELKFHSDWLVHGVEYAVLGILLARTLRLTWRFRSFRTLVFVSVLLATFYAISDEWHQSFVPSRTADAHDVAADSLGAWAGAALWVSRQKHSKKKA